LCKDISDNLHNVRTFDLSILKGFGSRGKFLDDIYTFEMFNKLENNIVNGETITPINISHLANSNTNLQSQINNKLDISNNTTVNNQTITKENISYLSGVSSNIQTQINDINSNLSNNYLDKTTNQTINSNKTIATTKKLIFDNGSFLNVNNLDITPIEISYLKNLTSNIQNQINNIGAPQWVDYTFSDGKFLKALLINSGIPSNGTDPNMGTLRNTLKYYYLLNGKNLTIKFSYTTNDRAGQTNGSGYYYIRLPTGMTIDTTKVITSNTKTNLTNGTDHLAASISGQGYFLNDGIGNRLMIAFPYDNNKLMFSLSERNAQGPALGSGWGQFSTVFAMQCEITLPIN
jgi:hypothetical protein